MRLLQPARQQVLQRRVHLAPGPADQGHAVRHQGALAADYERIAANRASFGDFDPFGDFDLIFGAAKLSLQDRGRARPLPRAHLRRDQHPALEPRLAPPAHGGGRRAQAQVRLMGRRQERRARRRHRRRSSAHDSRAPRPRAVQALSPQGLRRLVRAHPRRPAGRRRTRARGRLGRRVLPRALPGASLLRDRGLGGRLAGRGRPRPAVPRRRPARDRDDQRLPPPAERTRVSSARPRAPCAAAARSSWSSRGSPRGRASSMAISTRSPSNPTPRSGSSRRAAPCRAPTTRFRGSCSRAIARGSSGSFRSGRSSGSSRSCR